RHAPPMRPLAAVPRRLNHPRAAGRVPRKAAPGKTPPLEGKNRRLAAGTSRLNTENKSLAATINRLNRESNRLRTRLLFLDQKRLTLASDGPVLRAEEADLTGQLRDISNSNARPGRTARELGFVQVAAVTLPFTSGEPTRHHKPAVAAQFGIPAAFHAYDRLRQKVAALQRKLANLHGQQAQLKQLLAENGLLHRQRTVLREEDTQLEETRARLETRTRELTRTLAAAEAEHTRLSAQAGVAEGAYRIRTRAVAADQKAITGLQSRDNRQVEEIGNLQDQIATERLENTKLVTFLRGATKKLIQGAEAPSQDTALAGLLAVEAFRVTPDNPDDAQNPGTYNALWLTLNQLDAQAASELIAPVASATGKVGTTRSTLLKQKICSLVTRGFTKAEWRIYLPARAPYPSKLAQPCTCRVPFCFPAAIGAQSGAPPRDRLQRHSPAPHYKTFETSDCVRASGEACGRPSPAQIGAVPCRRRVPKYAGRRPRFARA